MANDNNRNENSNINDEIFIYKSGMTYYDVQVNIKRVVKIDSDVKIIEVGAFSEQHDLYEVDFSEAKSLEEIRSRNI